MVARVGTYIQLASIAFKVLKKLHHLWEAFTPQERETVANHLRAIYDLMKDVASRRSEVPDLPMLLMLPPATEQKAHDVGRRYKKRFSKPSRQFRQNARRVARTIREYQSSFTVEDAKGIGAHLNEIRKILTEVERRSRN